MYIGIHIEMLQFPGNIFFRFSFSVYIRSICICKKIPENLYQIVDFDVLFAI